MRIWLKPLLSALLILLTASVVAAQYAQDFDGLVADPAGVQLTDQDNFYIPAGTTSVDFLVYTYAGNVLGIPQNPEGGTQCACGTGPGGTTYARAQRDITMGDGTGVWTFMYDALAHYPGPAPGGNNIGSFSFRYDDNNVTNIHLFSWVDLNNPTVWQAFYLAYDATGVQFAQPGESPGAAWESLELDHWYRFWTTCDLDANTILEVGITDLNTMATSTFNPLDWYLVGGAAGSPGAPTSFRMFGGGSVPDNSACFDNVSILAAGTPGEACCIGTDCVMLTQAECEAQGGQFIGGDCTPQTCIVPTETSSWGKIKNAYR